MSISVDLSQLKAYSENLEKIIASGKQKQLLESCAKDLAARLLVVVKGRAPVDTGHLRSSFQADEVVFENDVVSVKVHTSGVLYASYVEHGHRQTPGRYVPALGKSLVKSFVPGQHFLDISVQEIKEIAPEVLEDKIRAFLEGLT